MPRLRLAVASAALALIPTLGLGQGVTPAPKTYTVKKGDTLWGIAQQFFSDPFLWPELYRANTGTIQDPHWIYPGEVLRIPDIAAMQQKSPDEVIRPVTPPAPPPVQQQPVPMSMQPLSTRRPMEEVAAVPHTAVRGTEYLMAPFVGPDGGPPLPGQILRWANGNSGLEHPETRLLKQFDQTVIRPPAGVKAVKGDRFIAIHVGEHVGAPNGQIVEPVGIVQIDNVANGGDAIASVRELFADMRAGDALIPLDTLVARKDVYPSAVTSPLTAKVLWIQNKPLLPSVARYLVFSATAADGVATGDQITLVRERGVDANGQKLPDQALGVAQILKVTAYGSSAVLIRVYSDGIGPGTLGRLTARMP